jgi:hypothetical protein
MPFLPNKLKDGIVTLQLTRQESYLRVTKLVGIVNLQKFSPEKTLPATGG